MRLKQHRQDVKWLKSWPNSYPFRREEKIGDRYYRLILAAEEGLNSKPSRFWHWAGLSKRVKAVLKDAEVEK